MDDATQPVEQAAPEPVAGGNHPDMNDQSAQNQIAAAQGVDPLAQAAQEAGVPQDDVQAAEEVAGPDVTEAAQALADDAVHVDEHLEQLISAGKARVQTALGPVLDAIANTPGLAHLAGPLASGLMSAFHETLSHIAYGGKSVVVPQPEAPETDQPAG